MNQIPLPPREGETMLIPRPPSSDEALLHMIERLARDPSVDLDRFERLVSLRNEENERLARVAFSEAFAKLQAELPAVVMTGEVIIPGRKSQKYPKLEDIIKAFKRPGGVHGFSLSGRISYPAPEVVAVTTILRHGSGISDETTLQGGFDKSGGKNAIQSLGSTISYLRRYGQITLLNIAVAGEDDDAQAAGNIEPISADQLLELENLIEKTASDEKKFCQVMKVPTLEKLPATEFQAAKDRLDNKWADMKEKTNAAR